MLTIQIAEVQYITVLEQEHDVTSSSHLILLEYTFSQSNRHFLHRYHLHDLGLTLADSIDTTYST